MKVSVASSEGRVGRAPSGHDGGPAVRVPGHRPFWFHDRVGDPSCPYLERWVFDARWFSIRLHRWLGSDDQRYPHDHGWSYLTFVFWGAYEDKSPSETVILRAPALAWRPAEHQHMVRLIKRPTWTLMLTGPERRQWGFWVKGRFRKRNRYFYDHGHHPCD